MMASKDPELTREDLEALLMSLMDGETAPPPELKARVLSRIARSERANGHGPRTLKRDEGVWREFCPGVLAKDLHDDGVTLTWLARVGLDARIPPHGHEMDEECFVLEGSLVIDGVEHFSGDYHVAPAGSHHRSIYTKTGCLCLMRTGSRKRPLACEPS